jgi:hypothetical protein
VVEEEEVKVVLAIHEDMENDDESSVEIIDFSTP